MKKASMNSTQKPKLEKLLLDADVDPRLVNHLRAVGFRVVFVTNVKVNYRDDAAIVRWARHHDRIVVCHDKYKDRATKIRVCQEIYQNGGRVIQVSRGSKTNPDPLTSLGKILLHREQWLQFFQENDGMVLLYETGMRRMPRQYLLRQIQGLLGAPLVPVTTPKVPRRKMATERKPKPISPIQPPLLSGEDAQT